MHSTYIRGRKFLPEWDFRRNILSYERFDIVCLFRLKENTIFRMLVLFLVIIRKETCKIWIAQGRKS